MTDCYHVYPFDRRVLKGDIAQAIEDHGHQPAKICLHPKNDRLLPEVPEGVEVELRGGVLLQEIWMADVLVVPFYKPAPPIIKKGEVILVVADPLPEKAPEKAVPPKSVPEKAVKVPKDKKRVTEVPLKAHRTQQDRQGTNFETPGGRRLPPHVSKIVPQAPRKRGRPSKPGKVSRITLWRRKKKMQGVMPIK